MSEDRVHKPQLLMRKESRSGIEPSSFRLPAYRLTHKPNRLSKIAPLTCTPEKGHPLFKEDVAVHFPLLSFGEKLPAGRLFCLFVFCIRLFSVEEISGYICVKEWRSFVVLVFQSTYNMHIAAASVRRKTWRRKCHLVLPECFNAFRWNL